MVNELQFLSHHNLYEDHTCPYFYQSQNHTDVNKGFERGGVIEEDAEVLEEKLEGGEEVKEEYYDDDEDIDGDLSKLVRQ